MRGSLSMPASFVWPELSAVALIALKEEDEEKKKHNNVHIQTHEHTCTKRSYANKYIFCAIKKKKK